jgi:CTP-dependent riboflavin kinase
MEFHGKLVISEPGAPAKTRGDFGPFFKQNADVFRRYFGMDLYPGSLNVYIPEPMTLQADLDAGQPPPAIVIPRGEMVGMPIYIGDGRAWPCTLQCADMRSSVTCWVFRRIGSRVPHGVIELVAPPPPLVATYDLRNGNPARICLASTGLTESPRA